MYVHACCRTKEEEEVCNFDLMYYMDEDVEPLRNKWCYSEGPPRFYWHVSELKMRNIPAKEETEPEDNAT